MHGLHVEVVTNGPMTVLTSWQLLMKAFHQDVEKIRNTFTALQTILDD